MKLHTAKHTAHLVALIGPAGWGGLDILAAQIFNTPHGTISPAPRGTVQVELARYEADTYEYAKWVLLDMVSAGYGPWPPNWKLRHFLEADLRERGFIE